MTELPTDYDGHVMRTSDEWCRIKQIQILDADGWGVGDANDWSEPLTELDFEERAQVCMQRSIATQPAGEHHTGTLNLAGEGNAPASPISDELAIQANGIFWNNYGTEETFVIPDDGRRAMRLALEAAYPAIRQQVAEEIAAALDAVPAEVYSEDIFPPDGTSIDCQSARVMRFAYPAAANIAREIGGGE